MVGHSVGSGSSAALAGTRLRARCRLLCGRAASPNFRKFGVVFGKDMHELVDGQRCIELDRHIACVIIRDPAGVHSQYVSHIFFPDLVATVRVTGVQACDSRERPCGPVSDPFAHISMQ